MIGSIANGMDLLNVQSSIKFKVTGAVLLVAMFFVYRSFYGMRIQSGNK